MVLLDPQARMAGVVQPPFDVQAIATDLELLAKSTLPPQSLDATSNSPSPAAKGRE